MELSMRVCRESVVPGLSRGSSCRRVNRIGYRRSAMLFVCPLFGGYMRTLLGRCGVMAERRNVLDGNVKVDCRFLGVEMLMEISSSLGAALDSARRHH